MKKRLGEVDSRDTLKTRVERFLAATGSDLEQMRGDDIQTLVHDVQAHCNDLERRNEELRRTTEALTEAKNRYATLYDLSPVAYVTLDQQGLISEANFAAVRLLGVAREELLTTPFIQFVAPGNHTDFKAYLQAEPTDGVFQSGDLLLRPRHGPPFSASLESLAVVDSGGRVVKYNTVVRNITKRKQAEEALGVAARQWQATFDAMSEGIFLVDLNCRILGCNQGMATLVSKPVDEILGCHCYEIVHNTSQPILECPLAAMRQSRQREEVVLAHKERWFKVTVDPILDEAGAPLGAVHRMVDITRLKESEEALRESEAHFRQLFESGPDAIFLHDQGKIIEVNEQACQSLGYAREELLSLNITDLEVEISRRKLLQAWAHRTRDDVFYGTHRRKDGSTFPVEIRSREFTTQGRTLRLGIARDITAQREAEQAIRASEDRFRELFNHMGSGVAIYEVARDGMTITIKDCNRAAERIEGIKKKSVLGRDIRDVFSGAQAMGICDVILRVWESGQPEHMPMAFYQDERISGWRDNFIYRLPSGEVVAVYEDITARVDNEQALRQSRGTLRVLLDAMPAAVVLLNPQGIILAANKILAERLATSVKEMVGTCIFDYLPPDLAKGRQAHIEEVKRTGRPLVFEDSREGLVMDNYVHPIFSGAGNLVGFAVLSVDITERKQTEEALAQQARFLQLLIDTIPTPIFYKDAEGRYLGCNQAFQDFYGFGPDQVVGKTVDCLGPPEQVEKFRQMDLELFRDPGVQSYEYASQRGDGRKREVTINKATFLKADGTVGGLIGVQTDVTEFKEAQAELRQLAARLAEAEELERQHLARELHDEVGQSLTALGLNLTLLKSQMPREASTLLLTRLADAVALVEKTGETIRNVMAELRPPVLDDYGLLSALRWYGAEFSRRTGISVHVHGEEAAPRLTRPVELALFRITQEALNNVAKHARASQVKLTEEVKNGVVHLVIADNGVGFDQSLLGQPEGRYRWGLMNMRERASAAGGNCHIESQLGCGTRVVVEVGR